jgi:hypothetical protein
MSKQSPGAEQSCRVLDKSPEFGHATTPSPSQYGLNPGVL